MLDWEKMWKEIDTAVADSAVTAKQDYEMTVEELRVRWGMSRSETKKAVDKLVESGKFATRLAKVGNGRTVFVYYPMSE